MKLLTSLLEANDKQALFKLQQRMIEDLPDGTDVDIVNRERLGLCIRVMLQSDKKIRFFAPTYGSESMINVLTHEALPAARVDTTWSAFNYDAIIRLLNTV